MRRAGMWVVGVSRCVDKRARGPDKFPGIEEGDTGISKLAPVTCQWEAFPISQALVRAAPF